MTDLFKKLYLHGILPVATISDENDAVPLANALKKGGVGVIEVMFRTSAAAKAIKLIKENCPDVIVGAGTVLTAAQVDEAISAGAEFIVSPGFNPETVKYCISKNIPIVPGCATCGEMEQAMALGIKTVKFFPAEAMGGVKYLKAVSAPYKDLRFIPTGGIDMSNVASYLDLPCVTACGGSFMASKALIEKKDFDGITALTAEAVNTVLGLEIRHIGVNCGDEKDAGITADELGKFLGKATDDRGGAIFVGTDFEVLKKPYRGKNGHIAVVTDSPDRARFYLEKRGFEFEESTAGYTDDGKLKVVYTKNDIGGFALHLLKK
ncbi:MAG: bifunctional 4-hydroxy-2-oxoglutarate aldolase/2-dehydro-3-deoxy-phosphogluconate aldolase [Clostridia bacterium]|nr:bifunctional 4-hydroxy-2-oxoglutarate aldolase/2-dehydro-3-deoxy-phosphogluconate aldolase [Clostridia bacterium]